MNERECRLAHWIHGPSEQFRVEHRGAVVTIRVRRRSVAAGAPFQVRVHADPGVATGLDGDWSLLDHDGEQFRFRLQYRARPGCGEDLEIIFQAPRSWRITWAPAPALAPF